MANPTLDMKASRYFYFRELVKSDTAVKLGINNTPKTKAVWDSLQNVATNILDPARDKFGPFSPTNCYRCPELEYAINQGNPDNLKSAFYNWCQKNWKTTAINRDTLTYGSDAWLAYMERKSHPKGEAVDFEIGRPEVTTLKLAEWVRDNLPVYDQIILECYNKADPNSGWVHGSMRLDPTKNRKELLTISSTWVTKPGFIV